MFAFNRDNRQRPLIQEAFVGLKAEKKETIDPIEQSFYHRKNNHSTYVK